MSLFSRRRPAASRYLKAAVRDAAREKPVRAGDTPLADRTKPEPDDEIVVALGPGDGAGISIRAKGAGFRKEPAPVDDTLILARIVADMAEANKYAAAAKKPGDPPGAYTTALAARLYYGPAGWKSKFR